MSSRVRIAINRIRVYGRIIMKPIIVHYINIGNLDPLDVRPYIEDVRRMCTYDGEYHAIFIPVKDRETKIDCLNPVVLKNVEGKEVFINKLNYLKYRTEEIIEKFPFTNNNILLVEKA